MATSKMISMSHVPGWRDWIDPKSLNGRSAANKRVLLEMAKRGDAKPHRSSITPPGNALRMYTSKLTKCYDACFDAEIRRLRPDWFLSTTDIAAGKKQQLLKMATAGNARPTSKHPLIHVFLSYVSKGTSSYDLAFDAAIRKAAPHWFRDTKTDAKKQRLLAMARRGDQLPSNWRDPLNRTLYRLTSTCNGRTYDPVFTKKICKLAPQWFLRRRK